MLVNFVAKCSKYGAHGLLATLMMHRVPARWLSTAADPSLLRLCVVGSGPAGFYTAERVGVIWLTSSMARHRPHSHPHPLDTQLLKQFGDHVTVDVLVRVITLQSFFITPAHT